MQLCHGKQYVNALSDCLLLACSSPGASPTPPKSRRDARLYRSYGENDPSLPSAVTTPPGRRSHVSQSLDFSRALVRVCLATGQRPAQQKGRDWGPCT